MKRWEAVERSRSVVEVLFLDEADEMGLETEWARAGAKEWALGPGLMGEVVLLCSLDSRWVWV